MRERQGKKGSRFQPRVRDEMENRLERTMRWEGMELSGLTLSIKDEKNKDIQGESRTSHA